MSQYPDDEDDYELQYQDDMEMLDEMHDANFEEYVPSNMSKSHMLNKTQEVLNNTKPESLHSPLLSEISYNSQVPISSTQFSANAVDRGNEPVSRRLFGTPHGANKARVTSTPMVAQKQQKQLASMNEVIGLDVIEEYPQENEPMPGAEEAIQSIGLRQKRRLERDIFGDIDDLYYNESYEDPLAKKLRSEEERDLEQIERILETRRRLREVTKAVQKDDVARLKALHAFKMKNLSYSVPQWPFMPLRRSDFQRVYVRFHSADYEDRAIDEQCFRQRTGSLLGDNKTEVWSKASEIIEKRASAAAQAEAARSESDDIQIVEESQEDILWVEKYRPQRYIELLSDEMTNRSLLFWLKMWDKVVFGREFKMDSPKKNANNKLNTFNKRTGKFERNGGWRPRNTKRQLDTNVDQLGRPMQKVVLLSGAPGLGKTTLAHILARHAGYEVREINASDDRTPEAFKLALENGTQMTSMLNENNRPNCIILDEIDGAPKQSIEFLIKFVTDNVVVGKGKTKGKGGKVQKNILKRPIICICNDVYAPALRPLRQIAFVINCPPIQTERLAERLMEIARKERLKTDFGAMYALADKSGNDVRCCLSTMQFFNAQKKGLSLVDVLNSNLGQKDRHQGLFEVWTSIFRIQRPKKQLDANSNNADAPQVKMSDMSISTRVQNILESVHSSGDYERLMQGVYENFLHQKMPNSSLYCVVESMQWFCFYDTLQHLINHQQNYSVYPYLQYGFVVWHLNFGSLAWPKINFPTQGFEFNQKSTTQRNIFQAFRRSINPSAGVAGIGQGSVILMDAVPLLKRIISPKMRSVSVQLLSHREQEDLKHTVHIMVDLGLTYVQVKTTEGSYQFQMEPDLDALVRFPGSVGITLTYFGRQLLAREVELERIRRATPKLEDNATPQQPRAKTAQTQKGLPNHLQRLQPKELDHTAVVAAAAKQIIVKDFFGRIREKTVNVGIGSAVDSGTDPIVKSPIWYRYKEGFNNAVRKDVHMNELL